MTRSQSAIDGILGIDFSPDTYLHMLYYGFPANDISTYIITHNHPDHFYPYDLERHVKGYSYFGDKEKAGAYFRESLALYPDNDFCEIELQTLDENM